MTKTANTILFILWVLFFVFHNLFNLYFLYWIYPWLDIPMHITGGILIMASFFSIREYPFFEKLLFKSRLDVFLYLFMVTILWEIYQVLSGKEINDNYFTETSFDIAFGLMGGVLAYKFLASRIRVW